MSNVNHTEVYKIILKLANEARLAVRTRSTRPALGQDPSIGLDAVLLLLDFALPLCFFFVSHLRDLFVFGLLHPDSHEIDWFYSTARWPDDDLDNSLPATFCRPS